MEPIEIRCLNMDTTAIPTRRDAPLSAALFTILRSTSSRAPISGSISSATYVAAWFRLFDPSNSNATDFATGISTLVDLKVGPDGSLYYLAQGNGGQVWKVSATPSQALNLSSRSHVASGGEAMIGGFIITGTTNKSVIVRALGPSLRGFGLANPLGDPVLELHGSTGSLITSNDNWRDTQENEIVNTGLAPQDDLEAAIVATLQPGTYSAVVSGRNEMTGVGLVEVYDLDSGSAATKLANISTRSLVQTEDDRLIGGFILGKPEWRRQGYRASDWTVAYSSRYHQCTG